MHVKQWLPLNNVSVCRVSASVTRACISVAELLAVLLTIGEKLDDNSHPDIRRLRYSVTCGRMETCAGTGLDLWYSLFQAHGNRAHVTMRPCALYFFNLSYVIFLLYSDNFSSWAHGRMHPHATAACIHARQLHASVWMTTSSNLSPMVTGTRQPSAACIRMHPHATASNSLSPMVPATYGR